MIIDVYRGDNICPKEGQYYAVHLPKGRVIVVKGTVSKAVLHCSKCPMSFFFHPDYKGSTYCSLWIDCQLSSTGREWLTIKDAEEDIE